MVLYSINTNSIGRHEVIDDFSFAENVHTQMLCILSQLAPASTMWKTRPHAQMPHTLRAKTHVSLPHGGSN